MEKIVLQNRFRIEGILKEREKSRTFLGWDLDQEAYCLIFACRDKQALEVELSEPSNAALLAHRGDPICTFEEAPYQVLIFAYQFDRKPKGDPKITFFDQGKRKKPAWAARLQAKVGKQAGKKGREHGEKKGRPGLRPAGQLQASQSQGKEKKRRSLFHKKGAYDEDLFQLEETGYKKILYPALVAGLVIVLAIFVGNLGQAAGEADQAGGPSPFQALVQKVEGVFKKKPETAEGQSQTDQSDAAGSNEAGSDAATALAAEQASQEAAAEALTQEMEAAMTRGDEILFGQGDLADKAIRSLPYYEKVSQEGEGEQRAKAKRLQACLAYYQDFLTSPKRKVLDEEERDQLLQGLETLLEKAQAWPPEEGALLGQTLARVLLDQQEGLMEDQLHDRALKLLEGAQKLVAASDEGSGGSEEDGLADEDKEDGEGGADSAGQGGRTGAGNLASDGSQEGRAGAGNPAGDADQLEAERAEAREEIEDCLALYRNMT